MLAKVLIDIFLVKLLLSCPEMGKMSVPSNLQISKAEKIKSEGDKEESSSDYFLDLR